MTFSFRSFCSTLPETSTTATAGLSAEHAQGAAFPGISWIELMVCLNLVLGLFLFQRSRSKAIEPPDGAKEHA